MRIKKAFSSGHEVFHLWANQSQVSAYQSGRLTRTSFNGLSCYSYQAEIGRLIKYNGKQVALINFDRYSNTTSKHQGYAWNSASHLIRVRVTRDFNLKQGLLRTQDELVTEIMQTFAERKTHWESFSEKIKPDSYLGEWLVEFNTTCKALGFDSLCLNLDVEFIEVANEAVRATRQKMLVAKNESEQKRLIELEKNKLLHADELESWKNGGIATNYVRTIRPMLIRLKNDLVETSSGASVTIDEAKAFMRDLTNQKVKEGYQVGSYQFTSFKDGIVTIGCHAFELVHIKSLLNPNNLRVVS